MTNEEQAAMEWAKNPGINGLRKDFPQVLAALVRRLQGDAVSIDHAGECGNPFCPCDQPAPVEGEDKANGPR